MRIRAAHRGLLGAAGLLVLVGSGCVGSLTPDSADGGGWGSGGTGSMGSGSGGADQGSGGDTGTGGIQATGEGGSQGSGGIVGSGGSGTGGNGTGGSATGGAIGTGGATGTGGAIGGTGGSTGTGGVKGTGGSTGTGGVKGTGGSTGTGGSGSGGAGGSAAPTFTQIYTSILVVYCSGSSCHNPGNQKNVSFASQSSAYSAVKSRVTAGNGAGSSFYMTVNSGSMPPGGPKLSAANLALIKAWIDAGALNN